MMKTLRFSLLILLFLGTMPLALAEEDDDNACRQLGSEVEKDRSCCQNPVVGTQIVAIDGLCQVKPLGCGIKGTTLVASQVCCAGLENVSGVCSDPSPKDPTVVNCEANPSLCTNGEGCFPQRGQDLFSAMPESQNEANSQKNLATQLEDIEEKARPLGQFCIKNSQCDSYHCLGSVCAVTKICRKADEGEIAGVAQCEAELKIDPLTGKCAVIPSTIQGVAIGPTDPIQDPAKTCQFNFPDGMKQKAEYAIKQTRAMEWFLNSIYNDDCFHVHDYLKGVGQKFIARRRELLKMFNQGMSKIDKDMQILLASKDPHADPGKVVSINGQSMTNKELAGRLTSGTDMIRAMTERNIVFKVYEAEMNKLANLTSQRIKALTDRYDNGEWGDHQSRDWTVPRETGVNGETVSFAVDSYHGNDQGTCRGGGFLGLARRRVYKRWHHQTFYPTNILFEASMNQELAQIIFPEKVGLVGVETKAAQAALNSEIMGKPMQFGFMPNSFPFRIAMDNVMNIYDYNGVRESFKNFIATLKSDPNLSGFNHEPELLPLEAKDCTDGSTAGACGKFSDFVNSVAKVGFADIYAFTTHDRVNYKFYFNDGNNWRRKLFASWRQQLDNLTAYYKSMAVYREQQNACLDKAGQNADSMVDNSLSGITEGAKNYYVGTDYAGSTSTPIKNSTTGPIFNSKNSFEFESNLLKSLSWNNNTTSGGSGSASSSSAGGSSSLLSVSSASLASRIKSATDLASSKGTTSSKSGSSAANASAAGAGSLSGSGGSQSQAGAGSSSSNSASAAHGGKASLMDDMIDKANGKSGASADTKGLVKRSGSSTDGQGGVELADPAGAAAGGFGLGSGSATGDASGANSGKDATGMSDEEKDVMMANLERTKSRYDTKEDDSLFTIINKTYVRNLDKILKKKPASTPE